MYIYAFLGEICKKWLIKKFKKHAFRFTNYPEIL